MIVRSSTALMAKIPVDELISRKYRVKILESRLFTAARFTVKYTYSYSFLDVYRGTDIIERTGTFKFGESQLANVLFLLDLKYFDKRHQIRYALYVFTPKKDSAVITTVELSKPMDRKTLKVAKKRQNVSDLVKTTLKTASQAYRKVYPRPSKRPTIKFPRSSPEEAYETWNTVNSTLGFPDVVTTGNKTVFRRTYSSVSTPNFKEKRSKGELPINPHSVAIQSVDRGSISSIYGYDYHPAGVFVGKSEDRMMSSHSERVTVATVASSHLDTNRNLIISRLKSQIGLGLSANLGEDIAEIGQTLRLFTNSVNTLRTGFVKAIASSQLKTANRYSKSTSKAVRDHSKFYSEVWLQYRYGVLPLLDTIDALKAVFFGKVAKDPGILFVKASASHRISKRTPFYISSSLGLPAYEGQQFSFIDTKTTIGIRYGFDSAIVNTAAQLGLTGPTNFAWNLLPLSFVIDWFYPIGQALESFSAFDGLVFKGGYQTDFTRTSVTADIEAAETTESLDYSRYESYSEHCSGQSILLNRSVLTDFPLGEVPQVKNPVSLIHAANAAALLISALTGRRR